MSETVTFRIPTELKERARRHPEVNWSEVVREAIAREVEVRERLETLKLLNELRNRVKKVEKGQLDSWLREDRGR